MRREVQHGIDTGKGRCQCAGIPDIANHQLETFCQKSMTRGKIVIDANTMTVPSELSHGVAADISCTPSYQDIHNDSPLSIAPTSVFSLPSAVNPISQFPKRNGSTS
jgi:hypothetical protein